MFVEKITKSNLPNGPTTKITLFSIILFLILVSYYSTSYDFIFQLALQEISQIVTKNMCGLMTQARSVGQTHSKMS